MNIEQQSRLAAAHISPLSLSAQALEDRDRSVVLRYDGMESGGEQKIFAMISVADLARLPADTLEDLPLVSRDEQGALRGNPDAFFMRVADGTTLFVDSDTHSGFISRLIDTSFENDLHVENGLSDLRHMMDENMDIDAPSRPAFIENRCAHVPAVLALKEIEDLRPEAHDEPPSPFSH